MKANMHDDDRMMSEWLRIQNIKVKKESASVGEPVEREGNGRDKLEIKVKRGGKKYITATITDDDSYKQRNIREMIC